MPYRYLLVTNFTNYWVHPPNDIASYPLRMLKGDTATSSTLFVDNTPTTFVQLNQQTGQFEGAWCGTVYDFRTNTSRVSFKVRLENPAPHSTEFDRSPGFYVLQVSETAPETNISTTTTNGHLPTLPPNTEPSGEVGLAAGPAQTVSVTAPSVSALSPITLNGLRTVQSDVRPAIFDDLLQTGDWRKFELYTYYLIKLLGIHNAYRFEPNEQSGKADGFFKFGNLAVLYDCTLRVPFEEMKRTQIDNYCKQLEAGTIEAASQPRIIEAFHHYQKQVWIITRGQDRLIETRNDIAVREVNVEKLIDLYEYRLRNAFGANALENELRNIRQDDNRP